MFWYIRTILMGTIKQQALAVHDLKYNIAGNNYPGFSLFNVHATLIFKPCLYNKLKKL